MRILIFSLCLSLLIVPVHAEDLLERQAALSGADRLQEQLPETAEHLLGHPELLTQESFWSRFLDLLRNVGAESDGLWKSTLRTASKILALVVLCQLFASGASQTVRQLVSSAGAMGIIACSILDLQGFVELARETIGELYDFSHLLLPVLISASAASGQPSRASALAVIITFFSGLLIGFIQMALVPAAYGYLSLGFTDAVLHEHRLQKLRNFLAWITKLTLRIIMYLFTGVLFLSGALAGNADSAALKAARITLSGMLPVVGGIASDAAGSILAGASLLKAAVGSLGALSFLAVFLLPFLRIGIRMLSLRLVSALSAILGSDLVDLLDTICTVLELLLAMIGSATLMCLLSCFAFLKGGVL